MKKSAVFLLAIIVRLHATPSAAQVTFIPFDTTQWDLTGARIVEHLGRQAVMGTAIVKDVLFENGIIEVDIAVSGQKARTYPGVLFRIQSGGEYEKWYIRPHRAGLYPDAIQYTPAFNGIDGWQLYNGEGYTSTAHIPDNRWIHFKLEVSGNRANLYMEDMNKPALEIPALAHGLSKGSVAISSPMDGTAYFSNFRIHGCDTLVFDPVLQSEPQPGIFQKWEISQSFPVSRIDLESHPDSQALGPIQWQDVRAAGSGLVDIARYRARASREPDCIIARTSIHSDKEKILQVMFGYSDLVSIFLNGRPLFYGSSFYQGRDPSFLGIIGYNDAVYLPLQKGENELLFYVAEAFGGWGFMAKDGNAFFQHEDLNLAWKIEKTLHMPESAAYDRKQKLIYTTNFDRNGVSGEQFISRIGLDGKILDLKWAEGLTHPTGIAIFKNRVFAVERRQVAEIDIHTGKIVIRHTLPQPMFPNDIAIDQKGILYVSDSQKGAIYISKGGRFGEWIKLPELAGINGLCIHQGRLLAGITSDHSLKSIGLKTQKMETLVRFSEGIMDGIQADEDGNILISHYDSRLYRFSPSGQVTNLLYLPITRCADFEYIPGERMLVIPGLEANEVSAYRIAR